MLGRLFLVLGTLVLYKTERLSLGTLLALVNYYTRDLHGSALMPQDILNLGTAAEVLGSYTPVSYTHLR